MYIPLIIAAGGGGRGYSSQSETQLEQMDYDLSQPGRNGKSHTAGTPRTAFIWVGTVCMCMQLIVLWLSAYVGKHNILHTAI